MNNKKRVVFSFLFVILVFYCLNGIYANDNLENDNLTAISDDNLTTISDDNLIEISDDNLTTITEDDMTSIDNEAVLTEEEYVPDPNGIYVSPNNTKIGNGSYSNPYRSISTAIDNSKDGKTIYLANGTYNISSPIYIAKNSLTITSYDGGTPIIDGQGKTTLLGLDSNFKFIFSGITFKNGYATNGGVFNFQSYNQFDGTFYNCTFINNTATDKGGVFYVGRSDVNYNMWDFLYLTSCGFYNNSASSGSIYWSNCLSALSMQYCVSSGNTNYAIFSGGNRVCDLLQNYWGVENTNNIIHINSGTPVNSKLVLVSDIENPNINNEIILTAKLVCEEGSDFSSSAYIPEIPITFATTSGVLSNISQSIIGNKATVVLNPSEVGLLTVTASAFEDSVEKSLNILQAPLYASPTAVDGGGDGSFNNPYSFKDAVNAINNGAIDIIDLFEGKYVFDESYLLMRNATIHPYSTPYMTSKINIRADNGFLTLADGVRVDMCNITVSNSSLSSSPLFTLQENSNLNLTNMVIKDNSLTGESNALIGEVGNDAVLNIKYSHIANNIPYSQIGRLFVNNGTIIANYNWWGSNRGCEYYEKLSSGNAIDAAKWLILSQSQEKKVLRTEWSSIFTITLTDNENNTFAEYLPSIDLTFETNTGDLAILEYVLSSENRYSVSNKISATTADAIVETISDNETLNTFFEYEIPLTEIFVAVDGDDENGNGSLEKPFLTISKAITRAKEAGATIYLLEGLYDVSVVCENLYYSNGVGGLNSINNRNITFSSYGGEVVFDRTNSFYVFGFGTNTNANIIGIIFANTKFDAGSKFGAIQSSGNLTIRNCSFTNVSTGGNFAEFICNRNGRLQIYDSNFTNISVAGPSNTNGAIHTTGSNAYTYAHNCYFANNGHYMLNNSGVVSYEFGNAESAFRCQQGTVVAEKCVFENSSKIILIYDKATANFTNCTFKDNGGVSALVMGSHAYGLNIYGCTFINNKNGAVGVAMDYLDDNEIRIYNSTFINNTAINGGAVSIAKAGVIISNCYFEGNNATNGGAIYNSYSSVLIEHCEFYNNTALSKGGSIYTEGSDDIVDIQYNIFNNSRADIGGVIYNNGVTSLFYNIMNSSFASNGSYIYNNNRIGNIYIDIMNRQTIDAYKKVPVLITACITDDMANPITGGGVVFMIDGEEIQTEAIEGTASIMHAFNKTGTFVIDGNYTGSRRYVVIVGCATANVVKNVINITVSDIEEYYSNDVDLNISLRDVIGQNVSNVNIILSIDGDEYYLLSDENGSAVKSLSLDVGSHTVLVNIDETEDYSSASASASINIISTIKADDMVRKYKSGVDFQAVLLDKDGNPLENTVVSIFVDGDEYEVTTDSNGIAVLNENLTVGTYNIIIKNPVSNEQVSKSLTITKNSTTLSLADVNVYYSSSGIVKVLLRDVNGNNLSDMNIILTINGIDYDMVTDENGTVQKEFFLESLGSYNVSAKSMETDDFFPSNASSVINVLSTIKADNMVRGYNSGADFKAVLLDGDGNPLKNSNVNITVNGKQYGLSTDSNGILNLNQKLPPGSYSISIANPITNERISKSLTIVKRIVGNSDLKMDYSSGSKFKVRAVGDDGNYVGAGEAVTFKINGKTITVKTDKNGYAYLTVNEIPKTYTISATYKGYIATNKITVSQIIKAKNVKVKKSAKKLKIKVTLKKVNGKYLKGKKITIKFKGKKYTAKTNKKGIATFTIKKKVIQKLKAGKKYKYTATYIKSSMSKKVIVKK